MTEKLVFKSLQVSYLNNHIDSIWGLKWKNSPPSFAWYAFTDGTFRGFIHKSAKLRLSGSALRMYSFGSYQGLTKLSHMPNKADLICRKGTLQTKSASTFDELAPVQWSLGGVLKCLWKTKLQMFLPGDPLFCFDFGYCFTTFMSDCIAQLIKCRTGTWKIRVWFIWQDLSHYCLCSHKEAQFWACAGPQLG